MKILIIAPEQFPVPPIEGTSVENCIEHISKQLSKRHRITILSRKYKNYLQHTSRERVRIIRVPSGKPLTYLRNTLKKVQNQYFDMIQIENRPNFVPLVRKTFPTTMISVFLHSLTYLTPPQTTLVKAIKNLRGANLIITNSKSLQSNVCAMFPTYKKNIKYIHLGVDVHQFTPPTPHQKQLVRQKLNLSDGINVLFAGRLIPQKGIPLLIQAVNIAHESIPSIQLIIAGRIRKTDHNRYLKYLSSISHVPIYFLGSIPKRKMHEVFWAADCMVCPSQEHEAFGLVVVEALASGVPCIASKIGGIPEIIRNDSNGILVEDFKNPNSFAREMVRLFKNNRRRKRLINQGRRNVLKYFTWVKTAKRLEKLYQAQLTKHERHFKL